MDPYMKGLCISNCEKIREEHNKFSRPEPFVFTGKKEADEKDDVFHFVAYFQFKNSVYEIDGLREGPILISDNVSDHNWIKTVQPSILNRISLYANNEIKFNLLAVVSDKKKNIETNLEDLENRMKYINSLLQSNEDSHIVKSYSEYNHVSHDELKKKLNAIEYEIENYKVMLDEENHKLENFKVILFYLIFKNLQLENERRQHNYIPFIFEILKIMSEKNVMGDIIDEAKNQENNNVKKHK